MNFLLRIKLTYRAKDEPHLMLDSNLNYEERQIYCLN